MNRDDDGETSYKYNTFVDDVAFEPTSLQALPTAAGRNVATQDDRFPSSNFIVDRRCVGDTPTSCELPTEFVGTVNELT